LVNPLLDPLVTAFAQVQQALFEGAVQPLMFAGGMAHWLEDGFRATGWLLVGVLQLLVMFTVLRGLERWRPLEPVTDRQAVRVDMLYSAIHRLGVFRLALFFTLDPLWDTLVSTLHMAGWAGTSLENLWPALAAQPLLSFALYLLLFDAVDYAYHRAQHRFSWWWQLHAVHHSQRQMTIWSDDRNHLLDDVLRDSLFVLLALVVGIAPGQFVALVAVSRLLESLSHANVRLDFGPVLGRVLVGPYYHRLHHGIGPAGTAPGAFAGQVTGRNFAVLFPVWDILFGTAHFKAPLEPTGIADQLTGRDYGRGFWAQQRLAFARWGGRA
jgi:sterol desaturase/sphingolipid hydroxylase (fatty acid hydroxylase superfamily)